MAKLQVTLNLLTNQLKIFFNVGMFTDKNEYWRVKGDCRPEMKKDKMYKMIMCIYKGSWDINSALCGCPAERGPRASCKHIHSKKIYVILT